jgi:hypothetical protein
MKRRLAITLAVAVALALVASGSDRASAQEALGDGGFESGSLSEYATQAPEMFGAWGAGTFGDTTNTTPIVVTDPVHSGQYAAQIDTRTSERGRTVFQDVVVDSPCFRWAFNVYPDEGANWTEIIAGWRAGGDQAGRVSAVLLLEDRVEFRTCTWHEIVVEADATTFVQTLSIDGSQVAEVQSEAAMFPPETMILGDVASNALHGLFTYDDVSLQTDDCPGEGEEPPAGEPNGAAQQSEDDDGSGFPWWLIILILIILALVLLLLYLKKKKGEQQEA